MRWASTGRRWSEIEKTIQKLKVGEASDIDNITAQTLEDDAGR